MFQFDEIQRFKMFEVGIEQIRARETLFGKMVFVYDIHIDAVSIPTDSKPPNFDFKAMERWAGPDRNVLEQHCLVTGELFDHFGKCWMNVVLPLLVDRRSKQV